MGRPRLRVGEHGEVATTKLKSGRWLARVQNRDTDGVIRQVTASGPTRLAAKRTLEDKLESRVSGDQLGVHSAMTVNELADFWLAHREAHGKARGRGKLAPQSLASYESAVNGFVRPSLGRLVLTDVTVGLLDAALARVESGADGGVSRDGSRGRSTAQMRTVLTQMLRLAVRHGALFSNPMDLVEPTSRERPTVHHLTVEQVRRLRHLVRREVARIHDRRMQNHDLEDWVDLLLGTGCRDGEALALRWGDLDLDSEPPTAHIKGTLVEPRGDRVTKLFRQDETKSRNDRTLILPPSLVERLVARRVRALHTGSDDPVFATASGFWVSPPNLRTRLRKAVANDPELARTSPHTLRRTVGTLLTHEVGLDAARDQLGHSDPSVTFRHYVGQRLLGPDVRGELEPLLLPVRDF